MFTAAVSKVAKSWKQPKCPSVVEWVSKLYMHTIAHYGTGKGERPIQLYTII